MRTLIVAITGASGAILGVRLLEALKETGTIETHLLVSKWGRQTLEHETDWTLARVRALATHYHPPGKMSSEIASGSYPTDGMVIAPCSMRTLAALAAGYGDTMIHRAADVVLKERRPLVLVPRETPLSAIHLENMLKLARLGVAIVPPVPEFYSHPETLTEMVDQIVARILDQLGLPAAFARRWEGVMRRPARARRDEP